MDGSWGEAWPGHSYKNSWMNSFLSCSALFSSPTLPSAYILPSFLASSLWFSLTFSWPSTQPSSCFLSVFLFTDKNWFLKLFLLCCCWAPREVTYSGWVLFPASPTRWETLGRESGEQASGPGVVLALGSVLSELHFHTNDVERWKQGSSKDPIQSHSPKSPWMLWRFGAQLTTEEDLWSGSPCFACLNTLPATQLPSFFTQPIPSSTY